jgi:hypothetical protein
MRAGRKATFRRGKMQKNTALEGLDEGIGATQNALNLVNGLTPYYGHMGVARCKGLQLIAPSRIKSLTCPHSIDTS